jgi:hypothetical protein
MCQSKTEHWVRSTLSNDEYSSNEEMVEYFVENGLSREEAERRVSERSYYSMNVVACDDAPEDIQKYINNKEYLK